jgi:O-antigen ligase
LLIMLASMGLAMVLTFSRGSFAGLLAALFALGMLRYRKIIAIALVILALVLLLPPAQVYVDHFIEGLRGEDLATQMRFGEYKDAFILIGRYPWFGVGFSGSPDIDTYIGVSNVYLLIGEEMGFMGMATFVAILMVFLANFLGVWRKAIPFPDIEPILLGSSLAIFGGLIGGLFDHYLFNLDFPHASSLLWLTLGIGTATARLVRERNAAAGGSEAPESALPPAQSAPPSPATMGRPAA